MAGDPTQQNVVLTADTSQYQQQMDASASSTNKLVSSVSALSTALGELTKRAGQKIELVGLGTASALAAATVQAGRFQQQMSQLEAQSVMTNRSFDTMARQTNNLRSNFGMTTGEIVALVQQLNNLGQGTYNVEKLATTFLKLGSVTGESVNGLADGLISLQRQMGTTGVAQTERYASALANLSSQAGTSAQSILQFANAIAPVGRVAGMSQNEIMGVSTAFSKAGADGFAATNAFNKMLTDITRSIQYGSPELAAYSNLIGKSVSEFSKMGKTEAVTQIFEAINRQGPDALKTLERFGLDGVRTMKSIQAVAQSGGIRESVQEANKGYNDTTKFNEAAKKAMDGLNEAGQKLKNTLMQIGEAFGAGLIGPMTTVLNGLNAILSPLASLLQMLGNIPGLATAAGAGMLAMTGIGIANLGKLLTIAGGAQLAQGFVARGFQAGRQGNDPNRMSENVRNAWQSYDNKRGTSTQRAGYRFGNMMGSGWAAMRSGGGNGPATNGEGRPAWSWRSPFNSIIRGAGNFVGGALDTMRPEVQRDVFNRQPVFTTAATGSMKPNDFQNMQRNAWAATGAFTPYPVRAGLMGGLENGQAYKDSANAAKEHAQDMRRTSGILKTSMNEMRNVAGYAASGYAGTGRAAMGMIGQGARWLGGSALGLVGGPIGAMAMAGMGIFAAVQNRKNNMEDQSNDMKSASALDAAGGAYRQALGEAAKATTNFADIVKQSTNTINPNQGANFAGVIDNSMMQRYARAAAGGAGYTDQNVANMTDEQLKVYGQAGQMSPAASELFGYDVLKRVGGDQKRAQAILDATKSTKPLDMRNLFSGMQGKDVWGMGSPTDQAQQAGKYGQQTLKQMYNGAVGAGDMQLARQTLTTGFNAAIAASRNPNANLEQLADTINNQVGGNQESRDQIMQYMSNSSTEGVDVAWRAMYRRIQSGQATEAEKTLYNAFKNSGLSGGAQYGTSVSTAVMPNSQRLFSQLDNTSVIGARNSSAFGRFALSDNDLGKSIDLAANNQANAEIQSQAVHKMADEVQRFTGSFSGSIDALQKMQNSSNGASDVLVELAKSAEGVVRQQQQLAMHYQTMPQNLATLQQNYVTTQQNALRNPNTPGIQDKLAQDKLNLDQARAGAYDRVMSISMQYRALQTQQGYAKTDFNTNKWRSDQAQKLGEDRAFFNFNLQRERAEDDYARQRQQAYDDFDRNRQRSDDAYYRQIQRAERDFRRGRTYAQADFNKSRIRQEEDFQHQVVQMTKQTAKSVYDIYARVNVQRTWDSQNLLQNMADQQKRLDEQQANLKKLREMGLSGDAISQMGLNDPANAQQLARMVDDAMADPALIAKFNKAVTDRLKAAGKVITDQDNEQWKEMNYSFKRNQAHALADFNESLRRQDEQFQTQLDDQRKERNISIAQQAEDFNRQMDRNASEFNRQMTRNRNDFNRQIDQQRRDYKTQQTYMANDFDLQIRRANQAFQESATDMTDKIGDLSTAAAKALRGTAKTQFDALLSYLDTTNLTLTQKLKGMMTNVLSTATIIANSVGSIPSGAQSSAAADHAIPNSGGGDISPIALGHPRITSGFGPRRGGFHYGVDLGTPSGTPVYTSMAGRVVSTGFQGNGYGNHVRVSHPNGLFTIYGHLSKYSVAAGQSLSSGQNIGLSGSTGNSTGPHLHYQVMKHSAFNNSNAINPMPYLRRSQGGGVPGNEIGDRVHMAAEAGEYVIPKFRAKDLGWAFLDALRANGVAGVRNHLIGSSSIPNNVATTNYYQRIDKGTHITGPITVQAQDPMEMARKMEAQKRMKALTGARG